MEGDLVEIEVVTSFVREGLVQSVYATCFQTITMSARSLQQLEKLMHKESEADSRNVQNAEKRVQQAEKALRKAVKVVRTRANC